ncbi:MAG: hypothetical protein K2N23_04545 [Clostridia bacterium]|nr:hypothetical protein [Clostridia bacterium]
MSVRLIRENSDTPNITNRDDARMIRYAYGGQNGYVKGKGAELRHSVNGNVFTLNSGVINLQGWEVEVDSNGWDVTLSSSDTARKYCTVYCEVNLSLGGSAKIDLMTSITDYPDVPEGDDLTKNSNGIARLVLYKFITQVGNIFGVEKVVNAIEYSGQPLKGYDIKKGTIEERLTNLGFRSGVITGSERYRIRNYSLTRQGNYVIGYVTFTVNALAVQTEVICNLPINFRPKNEYQMSYPAQASNGMIVSVSVTVKTNGEVIIPLTPTIITAPEIYFGFEAPPIK